MFSLEAPWEIHLCEELPGVYACDEFTAQGKTLLFHPYKTTPANVVCDGATLVPEEILGEHTVIAAIAHDPLYHRMKPFAKAMRWTMRKTRKFFDKIYGALLLGLARRVVDPVKRKLLIANAYIQYAGVRAFGGIAHAAYGVAGIILLCLIPLLTGCGLDGVIEQDWETPQYTQEESRVVAHGRAFVFTTNIVTGALKEGSKK